MLVAPLARCDENESSNRELYLVLEPVRWHDGECGFGGKRELHLVLQVVRWHDE
jgi:hypothetical protein